MAKILTVDIEVYNTTDDDWPQGTYLVHGYDDVLWTDELDIALLFLKQQIEERINDEKG